MGRLNCVFIGLLCLVSLGDCFYYRYKMDVGNPNTLCPPNHTVCSDGRDNYLCNSNALLSSNCVNYRPIMLTNLETKRFVEGHNGIRNKVAYDFGIANMNILHWSRELHLMATDYLRECRVEMDQCLLIGEKELKVGNAILFRKRLEGRWTGRCVRKWYLEIGADVKNYDKFKVKRAQTHGMGNFTRVTWPLTEFVGCSAARMFGGNLIVCFYYPTFPEDNFDKGIVEGKPCSRCNSDRPICSQIFVGLCGLDVAMATGFVVRPDTLLTAIALLIIFLVVKFISYLGALTEASPP